MMSELTMHDELWLALRNAPSHRVTRALCLRHGLLFWIAFGFLILHDCLAWLEVYTRRIETIATECSVTMTMIGFLLISQFTGEDLLQAYQNRLRRLILVESELGS